MYANHEKYKQQRIIASFVIMVAVVMATVGVRALNSNPAAVASASATTSAPAPVSSAISSGPAPTSSQTTAPTPASSPAASSGYKNGTFTAQQSYYTPGGSEGITVMLTIQNGTVTDSTIQNQSNNGASQDYQATFANEYKAYVVGRKLNNIQLSQVSGSSLTTEGFNAALDQIKAQAQS